jgi:exo-beta-1,3-glucanase (GH17 family)
MKLFAGVYDLSTLSDEIALIVDAATNDWDNVHTVAIGNELVNAGTADAATVVAALKTAKTLLTAAGYTGSVVTVDTLVAMRNYPELCNESDYCACNSHPFFDGGYTADEAGSFLTTQIQTLADVVDSGKSIVVTETGWPWKGETNGKAVPSTANQKTAIAAIKTAFTDNPSGVIIFTPFNDYWKTNDASQFEAEQYWGFLGDAPSG